MEDTIINIIKELINKDIIDNAYEKRLETIEFKDDKNLKASIKVIIDFNDVYFKNFEYTLLHNSLVYAIENNDKDFLNYVIKNINIIKDIINTNSLFKTKISEYAIKNIYNKMDDNMKFKEELNENTINQHKNLFINIEKKYVKFKGIGNLYRDLILDLVFKYPDIIKDDVSFLEEFLFTKKFDVFFIIHNRNYINKDNIDEYKIILTRLILGDNYLSTELELIEDELDEYLNDLDDEYDYDDETIELSSNINKYLNECIKNNNFVLPSDNNLRFNMYRKFLIYNSGDYDKSFDYDTINSDNEKKLKLTKINPLSKIDLI